MLYFRSYLCSLNFLRLPLWPMDYLKMWYLISNCWIIFYCFCYWSPVILYYGQKLYSIWFNSLKFFEVCFMTQHIKYPIMSHGVLYLSIIFHCLMVSFIYSISLLIFCLVLWNAENRILNSPVIILDLTVLLSFLSVYVSCIWFHEFCWLVHIHLVSLYLFDGFIFLLLSNVLLCLS